MPCSARCRSARSPSRPGSPSARCASTPLAGGLPDEWHLVHLGSRAVGGAGLVLTEATAVSPVGRISPADVGLWSDAHVAAWRPIAAFTRAQGSVPGVQLGHAGRKGSSHPPFDPRHGGVPDAQGGWTPVAPSAVPFSET
ncbi:hypothetical protein ACQPW3_40685 [Actinosynnema sp. CA-248983]